MEITNIFIRSFLQINNYEVLEMDEGKNWGGYYILRSDEKSDYKILWLKPKRVRALRYHGLTGSAHKETWKALTEIRVILGHTDLAINKDQFDEEISNLQILDVDPNETVEIPKGYLHGLVNPFETDIYLFEYRESDHVETTEEREKNTKVVYDQTGEFNAPRWPSELLFRIMEKSE
ncbi:MAG: hypothetical protein Q9M91_03910 [Candidatus Dojkabacteria bacterium]|nr:hypothetical protein [Candidatus Dojkabacteria bacterium]MDQ7020958.1 hypothetical protein [Candidatus Dojkabacteria bacterium]